MQGQAPPRLAVSLGVARDLAAAWQARETSLACLYGHGEPYHGVRITVVDSMALLPACGAPAIGVLGFLYGEEEREAVLTAMGGVLRRRPDLQIAGEVHGLDRVMSEGHWMTAPLVWWAIRPAPTGPERVS